MINFAVIFTNDLEDETFILSVIDSTPCSMQQD